jgi:replication-associated recombination protein RarA
MQDSLAEARERVKIAIADHVPIDCESIAADPWIVSSRLQKSIRRGETEIAQRAALTLLTLKGPAIWRRLMVIAVADVGVVSTDALTAVVAASSDAAFRNACGGNDRVAAYLAGLLAKAPKDRSADHLAGAKIEITGLELPQCLRYEHQSIMCRFSLSNQQAFAINILLIGTNERI